MKNIFKLYKYLDNYLWKLIGLVLISSLVAAMQSVMPLVVKQIIDIITKSTSAGKLTPQIILWLFVLLLAGLIGNIATYFQERQSDQQQLEVALRLRRKVMDLMLRLSPSYTEHRGAGKILQYITEGINQFRSWLMQASYTISNIVFIIIAFGVIFSKSLPAAIVFSIFFGPILVFVTVKKSRITKPYLDEWQEAGARQYGLLSESISNLGMIKSMSAEQAINKRYDQYASEVNVIANKTQEVQRRFNTGRDISASLYQFIAIAIATASAIYGKLSPADIFVFAYFASNLTSSINPIARILQTTTEVDVAAGKLIELLESKPDVEDLPDAVPLVQLESIEFIKVGFTYPDGKKNKGAISNLSFKIEGDKTVALVGPSGTGKSTITKLLLRFYEPTEGQILINGQDISSFTQDSIRQHIGMVMQDVALFNASVEENLAMANARADKAAIIHAAKQAHADEFIKDLPKGYKTIVGERGVKLSGGQKQRVAIARAILKDPQLIILDEATSALDSESERLVQAGLSKLMAGRSALVIAHRLSTIMHADEILVLKNGKVAERGNHADLINQTGLYKKLFDLQSSSGKVKL